MGKRNGIGIRIALAVLVLAQAVHATKNRHPPVTNETLNGVWEAISERDVRVFRMDINKEGDSFLVFALPRGRTVVYKLEKREVKDGEIFLEFRGVKKSSNVIHVKGKGVAGNDGLRDEGAIDADLIMSPDQKPLNVWELRFIKAPYIEQIHNLATSAEKAVEEVKGTK